MQIFFFFLGGGGGGGGGAWYNTSHCTSPLCQTTLNSQLLFIIRLVDNSNLDEVTRDLAVKVVRPLFVKLILATYTRCFLLWPGSCSQEYSCE